MSIFDKYDLVDIDNEITIPDKPKGDLTVIVGGSGTGKSTIMRAWGMVDRSFDLDKPIYKLFNSDEEAECHLISAGLRSIPTWKRQLNEVSNGERHRAEIAISLANSCLFIDEFTSLVDRNTARALCASLNKSNVKGLVLATCHRDVLNWLDFDHAYDTDSSQWLARGSVRRDRNIEISISPCDTKKIWDLFGRYHYLSGKIHKSANSWVARSNGKPIAMISILPMPSGTLKDAWRGHRTVVLPEFQGMGIGTSLSDFIAEIVIGDGARFFSKTAHPAMGEHRERSEKWKPTSKNKKVRKDALTKRSSEWTNGAYRQEHAKRACYSHEYIGST